VHEEKDSRKEPKRLRDQTTTHPTKVHQKTKKCSTKKKEKGRPEEENFVKKQVSQ
jgi:hypothetical protein